MVYVRDTDILNNLGFRVLINYGKYGYVHDTDILYDLEFMFIKKAKNKTCK